MLKAAQASGRSQAIKNAIAQRLLNRVVFTPESAYFDVPQEMPWLHMNNTKGTALALDALLYAQYPFEQAFQTAHWLITQLNAEGHWNNTSVNAAVFSALNTYYQTQEGAEPDFWPLLK